ncbi:IclR family transcriptional regulator [Nonomuraea sp. NPDC048826]|uniref:IclR family transcriptional regulator n=1 Tax=Nonomuraea sp. NPDC048826 TaxID=3364347 RepID=UPI00371FB65C
MTSLSTDSGPPPSMVERMTLIMDVFARRSTRLTLEDVARRTRLPRSTTHRILDQLVRLDWLDHTSSGYGLGRRALGLGGGEGGHGELREAAAPLLHELQLSTGLVAHLAVLDGADVLYLDKAGGRLAGSVPSRVGGRAPAHLTALGRAILAWLEPERAHALVGAPGSLHQELHRIRQRRGLAFERGDCFPGVSSVAAAIRRPGGPAAALSLAGDARAPLERVAPLVADAARQVSRALAPALEVPHQGWSPEPRLLAAGQGRGQ